MTGNLSELLDNQAQRFGEKPFLAFERQAQDGADNTGGNAAWRQTLSYREFDLKVNQACHYLSELGLQVGVVFNLHLPNCPTFLILWFAGARLGAIMMPTNILATTAELGYLLAHSNSKISFTTAAHQAGLDACQSSFCIPGNDSRSTT